MNAVTPVPAPSLGFAEIERLGADIAASGLFGIKTKAQAVTLMAIAQAEGRHPALAARDYDIIGGRPAKKAEAMQRDFLEAGGSIKWHALSDDAASATFSHPQGGSVKIDWTMERARAAGLQGKENYKKYPRQMLRSRVVSEGVRTVWPGATSGMYVREEVEDFEPKKDEPRKDDFTGTTLEAKVEVAPEPPRAEAPEQPKRMTWPQLLDSFNLALKDASAAEEIDHILRSNQMTEAKAHIGSARMEYQRRFDEIMVMADARRTALEADAAEAAIPLEDEVEIAGAENVASG